MVRINIAYNHCHGLCSDLFNDFQEEIIITIIKQQKVKRSNPGTTSYGIIKYAG